MNGQIPTANNEHWITVEEVKNEGREEGLSLGREEGLSQGRQEGKRTLVAELLADKFGVFADEALARLSGADDAQVDVIAKAILRANSIDEVFAATDDGPKPAD